MIKPAAASSWLYTLKRCPSRNKKPSDPGNGNRDGADQPCLKQTSQTSESQLPERERPGNEGQVSNRRDQEGLNTSERARQGCRDGRQLEQQVEAEHRAQDAQPDQDSHAASAADGGDGERHQSCEEKECAGNDVGQFAAKRRQFVLRTHWNTEAKTIQYFAGNFGDLAPRCVLSAEGVLGFRHVFELRSSVPAGADAWNRLFAQDRSQLGKALRDARQSKSKCAA